MEHHEKMAILTILVLIATISSAIGYGIGNRNGIEYQKTQPVNLELTAYSGSDIVEVQHLPLSQRNRVGVLTSSDFVLKNNVTTYGMILVP